MGRITKKKIEFTKEHIANRELILEMLGYENRVMLGDIGKNLYNSYGWDRYTSLDTQYAINRMTLDHFDFSTDDKSTQNYRTIFQHYYNSPADYDKEIINSVVYMRENKILFYTDAVLKIDDRYVDVPLLTMDNKRTSIDAVVADNFSGNKHMLLAAFSAS